MPAMYILECSDGSYYVGSTKNLESRLWEHQNGKGAAYTRRRLPVRLIYSEEYERVADAFVREKQVQGWGRAKREALIRGDYAEIRRLGQQSRGTRARHLRDEPAAVVEDLPVVEPGEPQGRA